MDYDKTARLFGQFANPVRLRILSALLDGERSVTGLTSVCEVSLSGVSQHLSRLAQSGHVSGRRDAQSIFYSLTEPQRVRRILDSAKE